MPSMIGVGRTYLFPLCLFSLVLGATAAYSAEPMSKQSAEPIAQESSSMYGQAVAHAEDALHATREHNLDKAVKHAEMALREARSAQRDFEVMKVEPDAQQDFAEGIKSLEEAIALAHKGGDQKIIEVALIKTLGKWGPVRVADGGKGDGGCHGEGCSLTPCGGCANPGQTKCNRFYPNRVCTSGGACVCYCM